MRDFCQRFMFDSGHVRGQVVTLEHSLATALKRKAYPPILAALQGQAFAAVSLLANTVKMHGGLILQVQGDGPVSTLVAQANDHGHLRGLVHGDAENLQSQEFSQLVGNGKLVITIDGDDNRRYQGVVSAEGQTLADAIDFYFKQSEQLPTRLWLGSDGMTAGGILLQCLPPSGEGEEKARQLAATQRQWEHLVTLTETITPRELYQLTPANVLHRLYHHEQVRLFDPVSLEFQCSCSRDKIETVLLQLGQDEMEQMAAEDGQISVTCEFCNQAWEFDAVDVSALFRAAASAPDILH